MDLRMFVLDIVKAVCVHALGLSGDLSRREMVERMPEVSSWLLDSARLARNDANDRVDLLRHAITSRHASARLSCLFEGDVSQADELATLLLKERDEVLGAHPDQGVGVDGGVDVLRQRLSERLARIFGGPEMPVAEVRVQARSAKPVRVRGESASRERSVSSETPEERVVPRVEVDVAAQRSAWLGSGKSEAAEWDDATVRSNTFKRMGYLAGDVKILGSMENLEFQVTLA